MSAQDFTRKKTKNKTTGMGFSHEGQRDWSANQRVWAHWGSAGLQSPWDVQHREADPLRSQPGYRTLPVQEKSHPCGLECVYHAEFLEVADILEKEKQSALNWGKITSH